jgi:chromosome segregation ATPase
MNWSQRLNNRLAFMCMHAAPTEGGGGGGSGKTIEDKLTEAQSALTAEQDRVTSLTSERDTARNDLTTAQAEVTRLTGQFNALTDTATKAAADVTRLTSELSTVTADRDATKGKLTTAEGNVSRLEKLCNLNGVDPAQAVPSQSAKPGDKLSIAQWDAKLRAAKTPFEKAEITKAFEKAAAENLLAD